MSKKRAEFDAFKELLGKVAKVPHDEVKAKLDAEKQAKKSKAKDLNGATRGTSKRGA